MRITISQVDEYLFVYGTLRSGFQNPFAIMLRANGHLVGEATVRGSIFRIQDYPGFQPHPDGEVHGELYALENAGPLLASLDRYEGSEFQRVMTQVSTGESASRTAWIYRYVGEPLELARIPSGDFVRP